SCLRSSFHDTPTPQTSTLSLHDALPIWGIQYAAEDRVGTAAIEMLLGHAGVVLMALFVTISTFGCVNGLTLSGPRLYYAMARDRSEEHTSQLQSLPNLACRLLLEKKTQT